MTQQGRHVVLGGTGGAGSAIVAALHKAGHPVRAVSRSGATAPGMANPGSGTRIEAVAADVTTPDGARRAVSGAAVVYLAAQPPYHRWATELPPLVRLVLDAAADQGARLVMVDNLYSYGAAARPLTEQTPEAATDRKGQVRRDVARMLLEAHRAGDLRVTIGRASDYLGPPPAVSAVTELALAPVRRGGSIRWLGRLDQPHSIAYLPDVARAYVTLGTSDAADGRVWHLPHAAPVTGREFLALVNQALPQPLRTGVLSPAMLRLAAPVHRMSRELLGTAHQWTGPFVVDDTAFREAFGPVETTPLPEAVRASVAAYLTAEPPDGGTPGSPG